MHSRILLKLSGEALGDTSAGLSFSPDKVDLFVSRILTVKSLCKDLMIVLGGGNICRGSETSGNVIDRVSTDYMGMMATVINALAVKGALVKRGYSASIFSSFTIEGISPRSTIDSVNSALQNGDIVFFAGGTGIPFFSTDTVAVLKACEFGCDIVIKGTKVDGIYDKDPKIHSDAKIYKQISYDNFLDQKIMVMDSAAVLIAKQQKLPLTVCNIYKESSIVAAIRQGDECSVIN